MGGATRIDVARVIEILRERKLGTGTMAQKLGMPNDGFQKILATGETDPAVAKALGEILGESVTVGRPAVTRAEPGRPARAAPVAAKEPDEELMSMKGADLIAAVEAGTVSKEDALLAENAREHPRTSVLRFLETV
jgi:hypothetical protein